MLDSRRGKVVIAVFPLHYDGYIVWRRILEWEYWYSLWNVYVCGVSSLVKTSKLYKGHRLKNNQNIVSADFQFANKTRFNRFDWNDPTGASGAERVGQVFDYPEFSRAVSSHAYRVLSESSYFEYAPPTIVNSQHSRTRDLYRFI